MSDQQPLITIFRLSAEYCTSHVFAKRVSVLHHPLSSSALVMHDCCLAVVHIRFERVICTAVCLARFVKVVGLDG